MIRIIIVKQMQCGMKRKQNDNDKKYVYYIHTYITVPLHVRIIGLSEMLTKQKKKPQKL